VSLLARLFFWGYTLMLIGIGASGALIAPWELRTVFDVPLAGFSDSVQATLLNQYRFLKAIELAFGIFCLTYRREIFNRTSAHRVFLAGLFAGVAARLGSWLIDGTPKPVFLLFAALELVTGLLVWFAVHRQREAIA
jgi:hypothetical protein